MSSPAPRPHRTPAALRVVHDTVPGRLRVQVPGLYRNDPLRQQLEAGLFGLEGVVRVRASTLTGNVLIQFTAAPGQAGVPGALSQWLEAWSGGALLWPSCQVGRPGQQEAAAKTAPARPSAHPGPGSGHRRPRPPWHALDAAKVMETLQTGDDGLSAELARQRLAQYGANALGGEHKRPDWQLLLGQLVSVPVAMLGFSAVLSLATGGLVDAAVTAAVVLINAGIGYATEKSAEKTISALSRMAPVTASVVRDGIRQDVLLAEVTVGDLLVLTPGAYVAADARLVASQRLTVDESPLTGESLPVDKDAHQLCAEDTALADRQNMVYMGTVVTGGSGRAIVADIGQQTEIGAIQRLVGATETPQTPMQAQIDHMGKELALFSMGICGLVFMIGLLRGRPLLEMAMSAISLAVAAVPEGLPAVATTTLALGIRQMRRQKVLIRKLPAVENLGSVQVICLDKTGTLTLNQMRVVLAKTLDDEAIAKDGGFYRQHQPLSLDGAGLDWRRMMEVLVLCNESAAGGDGNGLQGSPTENALLQAALDAGVDGQALRAARPQLAVSYRAEGHPYMVTVHEWEEGGCFVAVKGSPAEVLELCRHCLRHDRPQPLDAALRQQVLADNERLGAEALRVLGVAYAQAPSLADHKQAPLVWLGLVAMEDVVRPGMEALIAKFHQAGIETVMITGDQSPTAYSVGRKLRLNGDGKPLEIIDSRHLDKLDPAILAGLVDQTTLFSRVSPAHKLRIVEALQRNGKVVAMTGDGINDSPALKAANVGVTLGKKGTDAARSVADVILEDDDLHTMVTAIRQGRTIYANIRKSLHFLLSTNLTEIEVMLFGALLGRGEILSPIQLLWINLVTDIFPALALALEPPEHDVLARPPRPAGASIVSKDDYLKLLRESTVITGGTLAVYLYSALRHGHGPGACTNTFMTITLAQLLHAYYCRSEHTSVLSGRRPQNGYLNLAVATSCALQLLTTTLPPLRRLLGVGRLPPADLLVVLLGAGLPLLVNEAVKRAANPNALNSTPTQGHAHEL